jgi:hypothetical protein
MTDDNMTTSYAELIAAPPRGEAQPLHARGPWVGMLDLSTTGALTSGQRQHTSALDRRAEATPSGLRTCVSRVSVVSTQRSKT